MSSPLQFSKEQFEEWQNNRFGNFYRGKDVDPELKNPPYMPPAGIKTLERGANPWHMKKKKVIPPAEMQKIRKLIQMNNKS